MPDTKFGKVKVQDLSEEDLKRSTVDLPCARFGDTGYLLPVLFNPDADNFKNMTVRADDVWITSFPRSGTTFTQEVVWLLLNDCDFTAASETILFKRYTMLERKHVQQEPSTENLDASVRKYISNAHKSFDMIADIPSPRFLQTHLAFSLLPSNLLDTTKVIYVARHPLDVVVSYYHLYRLMRNYKGDLKCFWDLFRNDLVVWSPYFPHVKEAWKLRHHPNMLFIFYEELTQDLPSSIKRLAGFLGREVKNEQVVKLCEHMRIENFRKNESVNPSLLSKIYNPDAEGFVRTGKSGGWRALFDDEMTSQAQAWLQENLADTDLRFPAHTS